MDIKPIKIKNREEYLMVVIKVVEYNINIIPSTKKTKIIELLMQAFDAGVSVGLYGSAEVLQ